MLSDGEGWTCTRIGKLDTLTSLWGDHKRVLTSGREHAMSTQRWVLYLIELLVLYTCSLECLSRVCMLIRLSTFMLMLNFADIVLYVNTCSFWCVTGLLGLTQWLMLVNHSMHVLCWNQVTWSLSLTSMLVCSILSLRTLVLVSSLLNMP